MLLASFNMKAEKKQIDITPETPPNDDSEESRKRMPYRCPFSVFIDEGSLEIHAKGVTSNVWIFIKDADGQILYSETFFISEQYTINLPDHVSESMVSLELVYDNIHLYGIFK